MPCYERDALDGPARFEEARGAVMAKIVEAQILYFEIVGRALEGARDALRGVRKNTALSLPGRRLTQHYLQRVYDVAADGARAEGQRHFLVICRFLRRVLSCADYNRSALFVQVLPL